jgi:arginyl-tRNA synthetase
MPTKSDHIYVTIGSSVASANTALIQLGILPSNVDLSRVVVEPTKDPTHGDMATNSAMVLAKEANANPRELAEKLAEQLLKDDRIEKAEVAGPGFVNLKLKASAWTDQLRKILHEGTNFGRSHIGAGEKVNVEYVSANPTGPMHVGHGRGAVFGDALASLLTFAGYDVTSEYYINDAGAQVDVLARSAYLRYREALGGDIGEIPEGLYPGDYLKPVGQALATEYGDKLLTMSEGGWLPLVRDKAIAMMMEMIKNDLAALNIKHDVFFSERSLIDGKIKPHPRTWRTDVIQSVETLRLEHPTWGGTRIAGSIGKKGYNIRPSTIDRIIAWLIDSGRVPPGLHSKRTAKRGDQVGATIDYLRSKGDVYEGRLPPPKGGAPVEDYEDREQTLFCATAYGDDVDRPLLKSDGSYSYFASDIAYHKNKFDRGFHNLVDVWGADHGGYIKRVQAAIKAVTSGQATLDVKIVQLVRLLRNGEPVKMSKRSGDFVTLREVVDEVGSDAVRFMMLFRKNDAVLDFDLAKVIEQSKDNAVFYVQYGHARGHSIFRNANAVLPNLPEDPSERATFLLTAPVEKLTDPAELSLLRRLALYPRTIEAAAVAHEPHRIASYLYDLASEFHGLWHLPHLRFIVTNDADITKARLALVQGVISVLASGLAVLGVGAPRSM